MTSDLVGAQLGKYQIQALIGKGGMGTVYQAYDPLLERQVAIKVLAPHLVWEPGFVERFLREARLAARLKHAGIVTIYDVGQEGDWHYIVMEYLEGQTLARLIHQRGPLPLEQVLSILRQLADALNYAHQHGLIHRDVKPGNIVVNRAGQVTLTDFGVARAAQETKLTTTGALIGTPQYMSPEQARGDVVDHRTDIYSLGVVAYEMLTGRAPFGAPTPHAVLHQLIYDPPPPIRSWRPDLPVEVDRVLGRTLAKEAASRYETAPSFVEALGTSLTGQQPQPWAEVQPVAVPPPEWTPPVQAVTPPRAAEAGPPARVVRTPSARAREAKQTKGWVLWLGWLLASALGWAAGWALSRWLAETIEPWKSFVGLVGEAQGGLAAEVVSGAATWAVVGAVIGIGQWLVLRRRLRRAGWWVLATVIGSAIVGSVKWGQGMVIEALFYALKDLVVTEISPEMFGLLIGTGVAMVFEGLTGLVLAVPQSRVLRGQVRRANRWIVISALGWAINAAVLGGLGWLLDQPGDVTMLRLFSLVGGIVPGMITATGMVRLLPRNRGGRPPRPY